MSNIKGTTKVCGLIGNPVEHSLSPLIHNELAKATGVDSVYVTFKVENDIVTAVKGAYELDIAGMNVTVPWKEGVKAALVDIDPLAKAIGAVNTLVRVEGGFKGYNTDIYGIKREIEEAGIIIKDNVSVVLGAGGASRAITFMLASEGAKKIYLVNRSIDKALKIAADVKNALGKDVITCLSLSDISKIEEKGYLVVQTTSVGLYPNNNDVVVSDKAFYEGAVGGVDIVYNPATTKFMSLMEENGHAAYNGLKMLLYQAVAAFELWNDIKVSQDICDEVYEKLRKGAL